VGRKFLASPYFSQHAVFASPLSTFLFGLRYLFRTCRRYMCSTECLAIVSLISIIYLKLSSLNYVLMIWHGTLQVWIRRLETAGGLHVTTDSVSRTVRFTVLSLSL